MPHRTTHTPQPSPVSRDSQDTPTSTSRAGIPMPPAARSSEAGA